VEKAIVIDRLYHKGKEKKIEKLIKKRDRRLIAEQKLQ
jgi:hypothetical protein